MSVQTPRLIRDLSSKVIISVSARGLDLACVTKAGEVFTWGVLAYYMLGHKFPKRIEALAGVKAKQVACGQDHTAVCTEDGRMYTFGNGDNGQQLRH